MEEIITLNDKFKDMNGAEKIYYNPITKIKYTDTVRDVALITNSIWLLDLIASLQKKIIGETFQVWKLEEF